MKGFKLLLLALGIAATNSYRFGQLVIRIDENSLRIAETTGKIDAIARRLNELHWHQ